MRWKRSHIEDWGIHVPCLEATDKMCAPMSITAPDCRKCQQVSEMDGSVRGRKSIHANETSSLSVRVAEVITEVIILEHNLNLNVAKL